MVTTRPMRPWLSSSTATVLPARTCLMMNRDDPLPEIHTLSLTEPTARLRISILSQLRPDNDFLDTLSDADQIIAIKACLLAWEVSRNFDTQICPCPSSWQIEAILASINNTNNVGTGQGRTRHLHFGTALTQARDRGQDRARSMLLSSTFALPKKGPQNLPDPLTRDWYNPRKFIFLSSQEGLVTRLDKINTRPRGM
jgi:hypothetical protein